MVIYIYIFRSYLRVFNLIKSLLEIKVKFTQKLSLLSRKIRSSLKVWALKVDINFLNQHYKPADWMAEWLTDLLTCFGTQGTRALKHPRHASHSRHSSTGTLQAPKRHLGTRVLKALEGHLGTKTLMTLGNLGTWGKRTLEGHFSTQGTWALEALGHLRGIWALGYSRCLGNWALGHSKGTRALEHLGIWTLDGLYLADL